MKLKIYILLYVLLFISNVHADNNNKSSKIRIITNDELELFKNFQPEKNINTSQSFLLNFGEFQNVFFISYETDADGLFKCSFVLVKNNKITCYFPEYYWSTIYSYSEIKAISFKDLNNDGFTDIIIMTDSMTGIAEDGAIPFPCASIYFSNKKGEYSSKEELDNELTEKLNKEKNFKTIKNIIEYLKTKKL